MEGIDMWAKSIAVMCCLLVIGVARAQPIDATQRGGDDVTWGAGEVEISDSSGGGHAVASLAAPSDAEAVSELTDSWFQQAPRRADQSLEWQGPARKQAIAPLPGARLAGAEDPTARDARVEVVGAFAGAGSHVAEEPRRSLGDARRPASLVLLLALAVPYALLKRRRRRRA